jgi:tetratricopeptide (TPR) repeat protein
MRHTRPTLTAAFVLSAFALLSSSSVTSWSAQTGAAEPAPAPDDEDVRAKALFQANKYPDALAIYARLYQKSHHPTYQRNLGRCYQMMRQPDQAIGWFQAYLRDARDLTPQERAEIEGYITEMRLLQAVAAPPPAAAAAESPGWSLGAGPTDAVTVKSQESSTASPSSKKWLLWTGIGALVVGGVVAIVLLSGRDSHRLACPAHTTCGP